MMETVEDDDIICLDDSPDKYSKYDDDVSYFDDSGVMEESVVEVSDDEEEEDPLLLNSVHDTIEDDTRVRPCYVSIYKCPVVFEDEDLSEVDEDEHRVMPKVEPRRRGRGRPPKHQKESRASQNQQTMATRSRRNVPRPRVSRTVSPVDDDEDDVEVVDEGYDSPGVRRRRPARRKLVEDEETGDPGAGAGGTALSDYEKVRENNIRERLEMLRALGITSALTACRADLAASRGKRPRPGPEQLDPAERRKSARLAAAAREDEDYVPEAGAGARHAEAEPGDHSHDGIRRHPCKECPSCLRPDCRRCVFCRDKRKYGGKNIKKQKCLYKDKCSNPIILCNLCDGGRSYSCNICGEKFGESYEVDQHKETAHQIEQVRRRSSRLSEQKCRVLYEAEEEEGSDNEEN